MSKLTDEQLSFLLSNFRHEVAGLAGIEEQAWDKIVEQTYKLEKLLKVFQEINEGVN